MERNRRRAALTALCVLAVIFAASLFPATGFGTYPAGPGDSSRGGEPSVPNSASDPPATAESPADEQSTASDSQSSTEASSPEKASGDSGNADDSSESTGGNSSAEDGDLDGGLSLVAEILTGVAVVGVILVGAGFRTGTVEVGGNGRIPLKVRGVPLDDLIASIPARTMGLVVGFSASIPRFADDTANLITEFGRGLSVAVAGFGSAVGRTASAIGRGFGGTLLAIGDVAGGLFSAPSALSRPSFSGFGRGQSAETTESTSEPTAPEPEDPSPPSVEEAWESMTERLRVRNRRTATPEELARAAIERGFPTDAVRQLTDVFQEVRYGSFPPSSERTRVARTALDRIEQFRDGDDR